ncbi:hypothetical protein NLM31_12955 [Bradyrhizobium sp. CCGUVB4N]|uniref:hypothetical protein n=1 Tax=Bradyrhizobium sp. CCGUVB4N TaxID=2949631 RepID=UPI0020B1C6E2|nr:hypothetical protein [Bradyrhizobium sp. CCGUVB4N]MCP3381249.1 hypothetical protein [Bradyrhizobium sp. CCGUVB4N]
MRSDVKERVAETPSAEELVRAIISHLQKAPGIKDAQLQKLFRRWIRRDDTVIPERLNPASFDCWDQIIFRGSYKNVKKKLTSLYYVRIEETLKYLNLLPSEFEIGESTWPAYLQQILQYLKSPASNRNPDTVKAALSLLLGMDANQHYSVNDALAGEYFGYRRSSNRGRIVRFHIKINPSAGTGLLSFDNNYFQSPDHWRVQGCGMNVDALTYLVGHAHDAGAPGTGLGLRFFVLSKFRRFGWLVGLLNSLDRNQKPIASRILLIPASQHKSVRRVKAPMDEETILQFISNKVLTPEQLEKEIEVPRPADLEGVPVSVLIQSLIWNGTLRTLHGANTDIPSKDQNEAYAHVFAFQQKALERPRNTTNDIDFFVRLLAYDDVRETIMSKLPLP